MRQERKNEAHGEMSLCKDPESPMGRTACLDWSPYLQQQLLWEVGKSLGFFC